VTILRVLAGLLLLTFAAIPVKQPQEISNIMQWTQYLTATWQGYKNNYIFCGVNCAGDSGLVYDPASGYQATSEGIGYGLLIAVMMDDQSTFNTIYDAAHEILLNPDNQLFHWRVDATGSITGYGSATDAEQDIAAALIFAQSLVDRSQWTQHPARPYGDRANELIDAIWTYEVVDNRYLKPGDRFGNGTDIINLSYISPAWNRIFDVFQGTDRWEAVIDQGYESLYATEGSPLGLAPDWSTVAGEPASDYCEHVGRPLEDCSYEMRYEAIRVPWRIGLDCLWFKEERACEWSRRSVLFLSEREADEFARMYTMRGDTVVDYQDEAMIGMWLVSSLAANETTVRSKLSTLLLQRGQNAIANGYWGDTPYYYYNQSLAWFGAALLSEKFTNLL
jgi:endo-1,4-beta-D-glucanase Y